MLYGFRDMVNSITIFFSKIASPGGVCITTTSQQIMHTLDH